MVTKNHTELSEDELKTTVLYSVTAGMIGGIEQISVSKRITRTGDEKDGWLIEFTNKSTQSNFTIATKNGEGEYKIFINEDEFDSTTHQGLLKYINAITEEMG